MKHDDGYTVICKLLAIQILVTLIYEYAILNFTVLALLVSTE